MNRSYLYFAVAGNSARLFPSKCGPLCPGIHIFTVHLAVEDVDGRDEARPRRR
jgi:hypothetical protein